LPATLSADRTDVEPRRGPPSNNWQDPIIDPLRAGPQDTSDSSVRNGKDGDANLARGADSYRSCRHADHEPVPLSPRSSSDLEVIKADLAELLASFRAVPICASSPRSRERSRTRSETEEVTSSIRPEHDSEESPPRYAEERKSSVMSVHSCTSTASSSSAHSDTTRGYKVCGHLPGAYRRGRLDQVTMLSAGIQARSQGAISCQNLPYNLAPFILVHAVDDGFRARRRRLGLGRAFRPQL
jgi:hypothetical protein